MEWCEKELWCDCFSNLVFNNSQYQDYMASNDRVMNGKGQGRKQSRSVVLCQHLSGEEEGRHDKSVGIASAAAEIWTKHLLSRDSSVGTARDWMARFELLVGARFLLLSMVSRPVLGPTRLPSNGYRGNFLGGKANGSWSWLFASIQCQVKNGGGILPLPHLSSWHSAQLIKHRDNFTLLTEYKSSVTARSTCLSCIVRYKLNFYIYYLIKSIQTSLW
jgi:hypothetical protein